MSTLKIGVQKKGELTNETIKYLQNLELKFEKKEKDFVAKCENIDIEIYYLRDDDIPLLVEQGALDYGIVGEDLITETKYNISVLKKLNFGKCDIAIAVPNSSNISSISELKNKVIATTFPSITKNFFGSLDINIITYFMSGSVEASPKLGIADAITDIIVTGKSIETNGLRVLKTFFSSQAVIITQAKDIDNSTYRVIDLCGNPTLIINNDYREFNYNFIKKIYRIEQTGFLDYEKQYFEMEGKEFCGNGLRAAGICLGEGEWKINTNIFPYTVNVIVSNEMVELTIPSDIYINNQGIIQSEGISYAFKEINYGFSKSPCEGIIKIEQKNNQIFIYPKIWIKQIGTIIDETACASGSIAVAIYLNRNNCEIIQPSGGIYKIVINNHNIKLSSEYRIIK